MSSAGRDEPDSTIAIPVIEETLRVDKRDVVTGRIRVRTVTDTREEIVGQDLRTEAIGVERVPIDRMLEREAAVPQVRTEGNVTVIPVIAEVLVVEKRLVLTEELRLTVTATTHLEKTPVSVRSQTAIVENLTPEQDVEK